MGKSLLPSFFLSQLACCNHPPIPANPAKKGYTWINCFGFTTSMEVCWASLLLTFSVVPSSLAENVLIMMFVKSQVILACPLKSGHWSVIKLTHSRFIVWNLPFTGRQKTGFIRIFLDQLHIWYIEPLHTVPSRQQNQWNFSVPLVHGFILLQLQDHWTHLITLIMVWSCLRLNLLNIFTSLFFHVNVLNGIVL